MNRRHRDRGAWTRPLFDGALHRRARNRRQLPHRLMLEELPRREREPRCPRATDHLNAQNRIAAEREEIVVHAHALDAEHVGPHGGQCRFRGGLRCRKLLVRLQRRRRQRATIHFATRRQRQTVDDHECRRHHVRRYVLLDKPADVCDGDRRDHIRDQPAIARAVFAHDHRGVIDAGTPRQHRLHFAELDAIAAQFHLRVDASEEVQLSVGAPADAVARSIQPHTRT